ncbi:MAG: 3D domain-containing protein [Bdellovibrionota bacterium]
MFKTMLLALLFGIPVSSLALNSRQLAAEDSLGRFRNTYYYVVREQDYEHLPKNDVLLAPEGEVLARVSKAFREALDIEGTGRLIDGRLVNFARLKAGRIRYIVTTSPFGLGVGNCELRPFRTVAVDPKTIPLGATVRIAETVGMVLPNGEIHDGIWHAEDRGGAIRGDRIDLFVGEGDQGSVLKSVGIKTLKPLTVFLIENPRASSCVNKR